MTRTNVMITGVSSGIGYYAAKMFIHNGCRVFGSVRKESDGDRVKSDLGEDFIPLIFDVTDHEAIHKAADQVQETIGDEGLSCLINNAGIAVNGPLMHLPIEDYRKQFEVNVFGVIATTQAFLPMLGAKKPCPHPPGKIINISSLAGQMSFPFMSPYAGSKHALEGISNTLRRELLIYGIDVVIVAPGSVKTPIWEKGSKEEIDPVVLASDYGKVVQSFRKAFLKEEEDGLDSEVLASHIYKIFKSTKPKTRYAFLKKKFTKWTLPRYIIPDRKVDQLIKKMLKL